MPYILVEGPFGNRRIDYLLLNPAITYPCAWCNFPLRKAQFGARHDGYFSVSLALHLRTRSSHTTEIKRWSILSG